MKRFIIALFICVSVMFSTYAFGDSYDAEWVAECILDNRTANVSVEVITKYCVCMNNKMSRSESRSVSEWEKTHPRERAACDKEAGWK